MSKDKVSIAEAFKALYEHYGFTERSRQVVMANYLAAPLYCGNVEDNPYASVVVEGGTGIGKTMAYLLPAVLAQAGLLADALVPDNIAHIRNLSQLIEDNAKRILAGEPEIEGRIVSPILLQKKIFVSTSSKLLQGQLIDKDLKMLQSFMLKEFDYNLKYVKVEGANNFICGKKVEKFLDKSQETLDRGVPMLGSTTELWQLATQIQKTNAQTMEDVKNLAKGPRAESWEMLADGGNPFAPHHGGGHNCLTCNAKCKFFEMTQKVEQANVVVMNHHWFAHNIFKRAFLWDKAWERAVKEALAKGRKAPTWEKEPDAVKFLKAKPFIVFDEAHDLEQALVEAFTTNINLTHYVRQAANVSEGLDEIGGSTTTSLAVYTATLQELCESLAAARKYQEQCVKDRIEPDAAECWQPVFRKTQALVLLGAALEEKYINDEELTTLGDMQTALLLQNDPSWRRLRDITKSLNTVFSQVFTADAAKFNIFDQGPGHVTLMPITMGYTMKQWPVWQQLTKAFCSATLATNRSGKPFQFFLQRVGIKDGSVLSAIADSPYNYKDNTLLFLPQGMPHPVKENKAWREKVVESVIPLVNMTNGGTLFLFTSREHMKSVHAQVANDLKDMGYKVGMQGQTSVQALREMFDDHQNAVVFGLESFWQGLDVPGQGLRSLAIVRLPFDSPDDAFVKGNVKAAVQNLMKVVPAMTEGGAQMRVFAQFQVPRTILALKQGLGRLVRQESDKGIWTIFDPRFMGASYSAKLMSVLAKDVTVVQKWEQAALRAEALGLKPNLSGIPSMPMLPPAAVSSAGGRRMAAPGM